MLINLKKYILIPLLTRWFDPLGVTPVSSWFQVIGVFVAFKLEFFFNLNNAV